MPIEFHCPFCDEMLRTPDDRAGLQAKCPGCSERIFVPHQSEVVVDDSLPLGGGDWFDQLAQLEAKPQAAAAESPGGVPTVSHAVDTLPCPMCGQAVAVGAKTCPACGESMPATSVQPARTADGPIYAGFWLRALAALIDGGIMFVPLALVFGVLSLVFKQVDWADLFNATGIWIPELLVLLVTWPYFATLESSRLQASIGKLLLGLAVTDMHGKRLTFGRASGRHWAKCVSSFCLFLGYITAGLDDKKQAWHDSIAGCLIVRRRGDVSTQRDAVADV